MKHSFVTNIPESFAAARCCRVAGAALLVGCETTDDDRARRSTTSRRPARRRSRLPPDLTTPRVLTTATHGQPLRRRPAAQRAGKSGTRAAAARTAGRARSVSAGSRTLAGGEDYARGRRGSRCASSGAERIRHRAWISLQLGMMETDWAENRADAPQDFRCRRLSRQVPRFLDRYVQARQVPHAHRARCRSPARSRSSSATAAPHRCRPRHDRRARRGFDLGADAAQSRARGRVSYPRHGRSSARPRPQARRRWRRCRNQPARGADREEGPTDPTSLIVDDAFDRAWRRVGLALDRVGFTVVDRDRSQRSCTSSASATPTSTPRRPRALLDKLKFWKSDSKDKPEQYRVVVAQADAEQRR